MAQLIELIIAMAAGIASHHLIFIRGEWHMQAPRLMNLYCSSAVTLSILKVVLSKHSYLQSQLNACGLILAYTISLFASITIYRLRFHQLRHFPGPSWAAATKFWHVIKCVQSKSQNHLVLDRLHKQYGDVVRTGPTEVTIFDPEVFRITDGPGNRCTKAVWYDFLLPEVAINTTRDKGLHDQRRRIWDQGFNSNAMADYHSRIVYYARALEGHIANAASDESDVDITTLFYWFSFDVMGEFAFARSFDMLRDSKWHHAVIQLRKAMSLLGPLSPVPWLAQIGFHLIPNYWVVKDWYTMMGWCKHRMQERIEMVPERFDVSSCLIEASVKNGTLEKDRKWLNGDSIAIIIAGSDTVAPTLVFIFFELAKHPEEANKLYKELRGFNVNDQKDLQNLPHLNGIINETLRIHPPVPSGGYRESPPEGINIAGKYIPGGTTLVAPRYTIGRLESCFEQPNEFLPERWHGKPELIRNRKAFAPFSQGRYSCVGKNIALAELRHVTALLVQKYEVHFSKPSDGKEELNFKDQFTAAPQPVNLRFVKR